MRKVLAGSEECKQLDPLKDKAIVTYTMEQRHALAERVKEEMKGEFQEHGEYLKKVFLLYGLPVVVVSDAWRPDASEKE